MARKYWYLLTIHTCPVCGSEDKYRERVYEKPTTSVVYRTFYDYCQERGG